MSYTTYLLTKVQYRFCIFFCNLYKSHNDAVSSVLSFILMLIIILSSNTERYSVWEFSLPRCHKACAQHVYPEAVHARNHSWWTRAQEQYEGVVTDRARHGNVRTSNKSPAEEFVMPADVLISQTNIYVNLINLNFQVFWHGMSTENIPLKSK